MDVAKRAVETSLSACSIVDWTFSVMMVTFLMKKESNAVVEMLTPVNLLLMQNKIAHSHQHTQDWLKSSVMSVKVIKIVLLICKDALSNELGFEQQVKDIDITFFSPD